jgi:hypothetical protein
MDYFMLYPAIFILRRREEVSSASINRKLLLESNSPSLAPH